MQILDFFKLLLDLFASGETTEADSQLRFLIAANKSTILHKRDTLTWLIYTLKTDF